jgi:L-iditol 2-dehydrogenase
MENSMKAVLVRAPMDFDVEDVPCPSPPNGGLLLKVHACSLCGSDLRTLRSGHRKVNFPWIIGHEISGIVAGIGHNYQGPWKVGDWVAVGPLAYCGVCDFCQDGRFELCDNYREIGQAWPGGFAEYIAIPEDCVRRGVISIIPPGLDRTIAAIAEPVSSCLNAQELGRVSLGDTVVIMGAGPIGCIHVSLARSRGAQKIFLVDVVEDRLKLAEAFEPDAVINASKTDMKAEVQRLTVGKGADVIVTANPSPDSQVQAVQMARKGGRILLFGGLPTDQSCPRVDMNIVHYQALHLIGTTIFAPRHYRTALLLLESGRIPGEKLIGGFYSLKDFREGAQTALEGKILKAIFLP